MFSADDRLAMTHLELSEHARITYGPQGIRFEVHVVKR